MVLNVLEAMSYFFYYFPIYPQDLIRIFRIVEYMYART